MIPSPSSEQIEIVERLSEGYNVAVNSVAGSGKTTTSLHVARRGQKTLLLTYNARLKDETRLKAKVAGLDNLEVHSFHAFGVKYYTETCFRDTGIRAVVEADTTMRCVIPRYTILIVDESQDMTKLYYSFVCKILRDHRALYSCVPQILIIGDENQCIFSFNGSDRRFLTLCAQLHDSTLRSDAIGQSACRRWSYQKLSVSYRISGNMATFVNEVMLKQRNIVAHKPAGAPVFYCVGNPFKIQASIGAEIVSLIAQGLAGPSDIFVLAPSLKSQTKHKTPVKLLENFLVESGVPVYVPVGDDDSLQADCAHGKVIFSTFHQCKGLERKIVFVFSFEKKYFDYYGKDLKRDVCPCTLYVAATRATDAICFVGESDESRPLDFLDLKRLQELASPSSVAPEPVRIMKEPFRGDYLVTALLDEASVQVQSAFSVASPGLDDTPAYSLPILDALHVRKTATPAQSFDATPLIRPLDKTDILCATELTRWLPETIMTSAKSLLRPVLIAHIPPGRIDLTSKVSSSDLRKEAVSEINGLAIPAMLEARWDGHRDSVCEQDDDSTCCVPPHGTDGDGEATRCCSTMYKQLLAASRDQEDKMHPAIVQKFLSLPLPSPSLCPAYFLELSALYLAGAAVSSRGFISKVLQLPSYDWLSTSEAQMCIDVLNRAVADSENAQFEYVLTERFCWQNGRTVEVQGAVDILTPMVLWEVKCVSQLSDSHFLQLAVYAWLWNRTKKHLFGTRLFRLINVVTCEVWELDCNTSSSDLILDMIVDQMIKYHYRSVTTASDQEFLAEALSVSGSCPVFCQDIRSLYDVDNKPLFGFPATAGDMVSTSDDVVLVAESELCVPTQVKLQVSRVNKGGKVDPADSVSKKRNVAEVINLISDDECDANADEHKLHPFSAT